MFHDLENLREITITADDGTALYLPHVDWRSTDFRMDGMEGVAWQSLQLRVPCLPFRVRLPWWQRILLCFGFFRNRVPWPSMAATTWRKRHEKEKIRWIVPEDMKT
jgi:hypothetical protein